MLGVKAPEDEVGVEQMRRYGSAKVVDPGQKVGCMPSSRFSLFTVCGQLLEAKLADRLEHEVPGLHLGCRLLPQQAAGHELGNSSEDILIVTRNSGRGF